jgi:restriction system protein
MGRRRREGLVEVLVTLPWWVSAVLAALSYIGLRWIVPGIFHGKPMLSAISAAAQTYAWIPLCLFGVTGLIAFFREHRHQDADDRTSRKNHHQRSKRKSEIGLAPSEATSSAPPIYRAVEQPVQRNFDSWSLAALRALEWKRFELLCAKYYEAVGFKSETLRCGADGGIDIKLYKIDPAKPLAIAQCKAWNSQPVGVKEVRELLGVMVHEKVGRGIFITTGSYTSDAKEFGDSNPIQLLDGEAFLKKIQELGEGGQASLLQFALDGDYSTPSCASCGIKMVRREGRKGAFWGCLNFPKCRSTFAIKTA